MLGTCVRGRQLLLLLLLLSEQKFLPPGANADTEVPVQTAAADAAATYIVVEIRFIMRILPTKDWPDVTSLRYLEVRYRGLKMKHKRGCGEPRNLDDKQI